VNGYSRVPAAFLAGETSMTVVWWLARTVRLPNGLLLIFSELNFCRYWQEKLPFHFHSNKSAGCSDASEQRV
jgi:hypothetical protein